MEAYINKMSMHLLFSITKRIFQDVQKDTWSITIFLGFRIFTPPSPRNYSKYPPDSGGSCRICSGAWCGKQPKESFSRVFGQAGKCSISSAIHWDPWGNWDRKSGFQIIGVFLMMSFGLQHRTVPLCSPLLQHLLSIKFPTVKGEQKQKLLKLVVAPNSKSLVKLHGWSASYCILMTICLF